MPRKPPAQDTLFDSVPPPPRVVPWWETTCTSCHAGFCHECDLRFCHCNQRGHRD